VDRRRGAFELLACTLEERLAFHDAGRLGEQCAHGGTTLAGENG
jgi:hypothetical protein